MAAAGSFATWETEESVSGVGSGEGRWVLIVALVAIGLVQLGWRPAWMAAGLVLAIAGRELLSISGDEGAGVGLGLWVTLLGSAAAVVLLVLDMFSRIERAPPAADGDAPADDS